VFAPKILIFFLLWGENTLQGTNWVSFTCIKIIYLQNVLHRVWALYFDFQKLMSFNII